MTDPRSGDALVRCLSPDEAERISAAYRVLVKPTVAVRRVPRGEGVLWQAMPPKEATNAAYRRLARERRIARAAPFVPEAKA